VYYYRQDDACKAVIALKHATYHDITFDCNISHKTSNVGVEPAPMRQGGPSRYPGGSTDPYMQSVPYHTPPPPSYHPHSHVVNRSGPRTSSTIPAYAAAPAANNPHSAPYGSRNTAPQAYPRHSTYQTAASYVTNNAPPGRQGLAGAYPMHHLNHPTKHSTTAVPVVPPPNAVPTFGYAQRVGIPLHVVQAQQARLQEEEKVQKTITMLGGLANSTTSSAIASTGLSGNSAGSKYLNHPPSSYLQGAVGSGREEFGGLLSSSSSTKAHQRSLVGLAKDHLGAYPNFTEHQFGKVASTGFGKVEDMFSVAPRQTEHDFFYNGHDKHPHSLPVHLQGALEDDTTFGDYPYHHEGGGDHGEQYFSNEYYLEQLQPAQLEPPRFKNQLLEGKFAPAGLVETGSNEELVKRLEEFKLEPDIAMAPTDIAAVLAPMKEETVQLEQQIASESQQGISSNPEEESTSTTVSQQQ
jgi:hypothetical protein